jgi:hypothetical protein
MLEEGLSYPGWGERWTGRFIIGSTLVLLGLLLLFPLVPLYGYLMRAMGASAQGQDRPPQWSNWTGLTLEGARALVVSFVYALIPNVIGGIVLALVFFLFAGGGAVGGESGQVLAGGGLLVLVVGVLVVLVVEAVVIYLLPAALLNVAADGTIGGAFDLGGVSEIAFSGAYITALVHLLFVWFVTLVVGSVLSVTVVLLPPVLFWSGLVTARLFGVAYRSSNGMPAATDATYTPEVEVAGTGGATAPSSGGRRSAGRRSSTDDTDRRTTTDDTDRTTTDDTDRTTTDDTDRTTTDDTDRTTTDTR